MAEPRTSTESRSSTAWLVIAEQELRDLWLAGRGLLLMFAYSVLLSVTSYLVATNQALNFLERRESVTLTLQVAVAVSGLLVLLGSADAVSGERERGTLETLLLTPASRQSLVVGKGTAALSLWVVSIALSVPYLWFIGRGVGVVAEAVVSGFIVSGLLALFLSGLGLLISTVSSTNRVSLSVSLFVLLALYAPTQLASIGVAGTAGDVLLRLDPFTGGLDYLNKLLVGGHSAGQDIGVLIPTLVAAAVFPVAALATASRLTLLTRERS